jgi:hypothetical protein
MANPTPTLVSLPGATGAVSQIAAGAAHTLALTSSGQLYAFGANQYGELGSATNNGKILANPTPTLVSLPGATGTVSQIAAGGGHTLALTSSGQLYAFGYNGNGELGRATNSGTTLANPTPTLVSLPGATGTVSQIAAGASDTLVSVAATPSPPVTTPPGFLTPHTTITSGPDGFTSSDPSFTFVSSLTGSTFECSFDGEPFTPCTTPTARYGLAYGSHTFRVRAISQFGVTDPTPAMRAFTLGSEVRLFSCTVDAAIDVSQLIGEAQCFITGTCPPLSQCGIANGSIDLANVQRTQGWVELNVCSNSSSCDRFPSGSFSGSCQINTPVVFTPCPSTAPNYSIDFQPPVARFAAACTVLQTSRANPTGQITCTVGLRIIPAKPLILVGQIGTTPVVFVPGAGSVAVSALTSVLHAQAAARRRVTSSPFAPLQVSARRAGFVALPLKLSRQATTTLLRKRRLTLRLRLRFTPTAGAETVRTQTVTLRTRPCLAPPPTAKELLKRGAHKPKPQTCKPRL